MYGYLSADGIKEASGCMLSDMFGVPCRVDAIEVEQTFADSGRCDAVLTFNVSSCGQLAMTARRPTPKPTKVIGNGPATVVMFDDGTKAVTKTHDGDTYDRLVGIMLCCLRKALRNRRFDVYEKPVRKLACCIRRHASGDIASGLRAIGNALLMAADAIDVSEER